MKKLLALSFLLMSVNSFANIRLELECEVVSATSGSCYIEKNNFENPIRCEIAPRGRTESGKWIELNRVTKVVHPGMDAKVTVSSKNDPLLAVSASAECDIIP